MPSNHTNQNSPKNDENLTEILDLLCVALHFAGVKQAKMRQALEAYTDALDEFDEEADYGQKEMIQIIENLRAKRGDLFRD